MGSTSFLGKRLCPEGLASGLQKPKIQCSSFGFSTAIGRGPKRRRTARTDVELLNITSHGF
jgi:hypothetical protein